MEFLLRDLQSALKQATAIEAMVILRQITKAVDLDLELKQLLSALSPFAASNQPTESDADKCK
jgi:hypothetical protein